MSAMSIMLDRKPTASASTPRKSATAAPVMQYLDQFERNGQTKIGTIAPPPSSERKAVEAAIEVQIAEAYQRGCRDGVIAARAEAAAIVKREIASLREQAGRAQADFERNAYAKVADAVSTGLQAIEQRIASAVARLIRPLVSHAMAERIIEDLCDQLGRLRLGGTAKLIKISGPERLLTALRQRAGDLAANIEYSQNNEVEVSITADDTMIGSQLQSWADLIVSLAADRPAKPAETA
jgi:hypothetical protein